MKMKSAIRIASVLVALAPVATTAQNAADDADEPLPRYDVEIVIFKNVQVPSSREFVLPESAPAPDERMLDLSSAESLSAAAALDYELLPNSEFRLRDEVERLVESERYELLLHVAWRQPGVEREQALPVWIRGGRIFGREYMSIDSTPGLLGRTLPPADGGDGTVYSFDEQSLDSLQRQLAEQQAAPTHRGLYELEGKITVALSRYLHTYTDLVLRRPRLELDETSELPAQGRTVAAGTADARILNNHRLREHRRMRSRNLHYIDNPEFALLVLITPYEAPEELDLAPADTAGNASG